MASVFFHTMSKLAAITACFTAGNCQRFSRVCRCGPGWWVFCFRPVGRPISVDIHALTCCVDRPFSQYGGCRGVLCARHVMRVILWYSAAGYFCNHFVHLNFGRLVFFFAAAAVVVANGSVAGAATCPRFAYTAFLFLSHLCWSFVACVLGDLWAGFSLTSCRLLSYCVVSEFSPAALGRATVVG